MTYVISEPCIDTRDQSCIAVCPVDCIHVTERMLVIDPSECIDCAACASECPVGAVFLDSELPEQWLEFAEINAGITKSAGTVESLLADYVREHPGVGDAAPRSS